MGKKSWTEKVVLLITASLVSAEKVKVKNKKLVRNSRRQHSERRTKGAAAQGYPTTAVWEEQSEGIVYAEGGKWYLGAMS
jgi:hypothetical protein